MEQKTPFRLDTKLTGYYPLPRELLNMELPSTALVLYAALLDRMTLSRKNGYADETGCVYVIYPIEKLAKTLSVSDTAVKRHLKLLEEKGLLKRQRPVRNGPNRIFLNLPPGSVSTDGGEPTYPRQGVKMTRPTGRKVPGNNRKKLPDWNEYYKREEWESL